MKTLARRKGRRPQRAGAAAAADEADRADRGRRRHRLHDPAEPAQGEALPGRALRLGHRGPRGDAGEALRPRDPRPEPSGHRRARALPGAAAGRRDAEGSDHHADGPGRGARQAPRLRDRRRRLHHQALLDAGAAGAGPRAPAAGRVLRDLRGGSLRRRRPPRGPRPLRGPLEGRAGPPDEEGVRPALAPDPQPRPASSPGTRSSPGSGTTMPRSRRGPWTSTSARFAGSSATTGSRRSSAWATGTARPIRPTR